MDALRVLAVTAVLGVVAIGRCGGGPEPTGQDAGDDAGSEADAGGVDAGGDAGIQDAGASEFCPDDAGVPTIAISGRYFVPESLVVDAGETVRVCNYDFEGHSVTSEVNPTAYTPGSVNGVSFDTGTFGRGERRFTLPAAALSGTVVPYYCKPHMAMMANQADITIR